MFDVTYISIERAKQNWCVETWIFRKLSFDRIKTQLWPHNLSQLACWLSPHQWSLHGCSSQKENEHFSKNKYTQNIHSHSDYGVSPSISPSEHDECASSQNLCDENAICTNTIRGHLCTCKPGYVGNGTICRGTFLPWNNPPDTNTHKNRPKTFLQIHWWWLNLCSITSWAVWFTSFTSPNQTAAATEMVAIDSGPVSASSLTAHPAPCWPVAPPRRLAWLALQNHTDWGKEEGGNEKCFLWSVCYNM